MSRDDACGVSANRAFDVSYTSENTFTSLGLVSVAVFVHETIAVRLFLRSLPLQPPPPLLLLLLPLQSLSSSVKTTDESLLHSSETGVALHTSVADTLNVVHRATSASRLRARHDVVVALHGQFPVHGR